MKKRKNRIKRSFLAAAQLLVLNGQLYGREKKKEISRYRFTAETFKIIAGRHRLHDIVVEEIRDELYGLGWHLIKQNESEYAIIEASKVNVWPKISSIRLFTNNLSDEPDETVIDQKYSEFFPEVEPDVEEGELGVEKF